MSLETITRQLLGEPMRSYGEIIPVIKNVPYCGTAVIELDENGNSGKWSLISLPQISLRHGHSNDYDAAEALLSADK